MMNTGDPASRELDLSGSAGSKRAIYDGACSAGSKDVFFAYGTRFERYDVTII